MPSERSKSRSVFAVMLFPSNVLQADVFDQPKFENKFYNFVKVTVAIVAFNSTPFPSGESTNKLIGC